MEINIKVDLQSIPVKCSECTFCGGGPRCFLSVTIEPPENTIDEKCPIHGKSMDVFEGILRESHFRKTHYIIDSPYCRPGIKWDKEKETKNCILRYSSYYWIDLESKSILHGDFIDFYLFSMRPEAIKKIISSKEN
jgi:hypothetical protein